MNTEIVMTPIFVPVVSDVPDVQVPDVPDVKVPDVPDVPDAQVMGVQVPDIQVLSVEVPDVQVPDVPDVQVPDVPDVPDVQVPDVPDVQVPETDDEDYEDKGSPYETYAYGMDPYFIDEELSDLEDDTKPMTSDRIEKKERRYRAECYEMLRGKKGLGMKGVLDWMKEERRVKRMRLV
jgi:hypothetical protein